MHCTASVLTAIQLGRIAHPTHIWGRFHHAIQGHLLRLITGRLRHPDGRPCKRLMILTPPQHGKSTLTSQLLPAIALAQRPDARLILLSYGADLASGHAIMARDHVRNFGPSLNPRLKLNPDAQSRSFWRTTAGGYLRAASIQGQVTGLAASGILIDDPFKGSEDSSSPVIRDKVWNTYSAAAETRLAPDGWVAIINTPWHPDDLCGRLLETEPEKWIVLRFPALADEEGPDPLGRAPGEPLFPERYPLSWYEDKRRTLELRGQSHLWDALYGCKPTGDATLRAFPTAYFRPPAPIWADALPVSETNPAMLRVLALDPSKSKTGKTGDYAAFADLTMLRDNHIYAQMTLGREPLPALYAKAVALVLAAIDEGRAFDAMIVECNMFQQAVAIAIRERLQALGIDLQVVEHQTAGNDEKNARIVTGLSPLLAAHRLHFVGQTTSNRLTVKQCEEVPNGSHDDGPDALVLGCRLLNMLKAAPARGGSRVLKV